MATIAFPSQTPLTFPENPGDDTVVATFEIVDGEAGEEFEFELSDSRFAVRFNGTLALWELYIPTGGSLFNFEEDPTIDLIINGTGNQNSTIEATSVAITLTDVNEAPTDITMTGGTVLENSAVGTTIAYLSATDPENQLAPSPFSFVTDETGTTAATNDYFEIVGATIRLKAGLDNPQVGKHELWVKVTDKGGLSYVEKVTITVGNSPEVFNGTTKSDRITGTADDDIINGGDGNDKLYGMDGNDLVSGGNGNDTVSGGNGDDILIGGAGKDKLYGGAGADTFVFDTPVRKGHFDHIEDFKSEDTIQISLAALKAFKVKGPKSSDVLSKKGANDDKGGKPDDKGGGRPDKGKNKSVGFDKIFKKGEKLDKKFFNVGTKLNDTPDGSNDYIFYNKKNGFVYLDVDGSGKGKGIEILKVKPGTTLTADDFLFI